MRFRLRTLLIVLAAAFWAIIASAEEPKPKTDFGFDPATIPPPAGARGIIARSYRRNIDLATLQAKTIPLDDEAISQLRGVILGDVLARVAEKEKLRATAEEVQDFYRVVLHREIDANALHADLDKNPQTDVGAMFVKSWKVDRLLYQRYGGTVIFQQGNPREPVGAYRQLLEEAERARVFELYSPAIREAFWSYFTREPKLAVVPPDEVSFDKPWWLQKPEQ